MHTLKALLVTAVAACAIARPPRPTEAPSQDASGPLRVRAPLPSARDLFGEFLLPRFLLPQYLGYQDSARLAKHQEPDTDWLTKEIDRINDMIVKVEGLQNPYDRGYDESQWGSEEYPVPELPRRTDTMIRFESYQQPSSLSGRSNIEDVYRNPMPMKKNLLEGFPPLKIRMDSSVLRQDEDASHDDNGANANQEIIKIFNNETETDKESTNDPGGNSFGEINNKGGTNITKKTGASDDNAHISKPHGEKKQFALTPSDKEYFDHTDNQAQLTIQWVPEGREIHHEGGDNGALVMLAMPQRQTRQNPNLSKQKHLLEPDIGKLKTGFMNAPEMSEVSADMSRPVPVSDTDTDSLHDIILIAAVGAALTLATVGFLFGWYALTKKAKAAADVEYPAYGVTGPSYDSSGDRKLAHSAHMYHYQHQKQQIIAMERNGLEQRTGSMSDADSEEENEEGDYTVYECPGFATTGEMEVKNPLFSEDPTPATPGKCQIVKPQPK